MSIEATAVINSSLAWVFTDHTDEIRINDIGTVQSELNLTNGSGDDNINLIYHKEATLTAGATEFFTLANLPFDVFNDTFPISFSGGVVKGLIVRNTSENRGAYLRVAFTGVAAFDDYFDGNTICTIWPKCSHSQANTYDGWLIDGSNHEFAIIDAAGSGVSYELCIVGTSG